MNRKQRAYKLKCARYHSGHPTHIRFGKVYVGLTFRIPSYYEAAKYVSHARVHSISGGNVAGMFRPVVLTFGDGSEGIHKKIGTSHCFGYKTSHIKRGVGLPKPNGWLTSIHSVEVTLDDLNA